jgi:hypothetical protein
VWFGSKRGPMSLRFFIPFLAFCFFACNSEKGETTPETSTTFDKALWSVKEGQDYPYRDAMLNDLMNDDSIRSLSQTEIRELLGEPDRINEGYIYYTIAQKRLGMWPLNTKTLVIKFSDATTIEWMKIHQ